MANLKKKGSNIDINGIVEGVYCNSFPSSFFIFFFNNQLIIEDINPLKCLSKVAKKLQFKRSH